MGKAMADEIRQLSNPPSSGMPLQKPMKVPILTQSYLSQKYTLEPQGIWARVHRIFAVDPSRSSGIPLKPQFRNPPPGAVDPNAYDDPVTIPAGDIADNPYWKRDVRRSYPQLSTVTQGDVVALLSVGSKASPKDDVLQIGDAGKKQLVEVKKDGEEKGLASYFEKQKSLAGSVLGPDGLPPMPTPSHAPQVRKYELTSDQAYPSQ
jgi:hypothetical protein